MQTFFPILVILLQMWADKIAGVQEYSKCGHLDLKKNLTHNLFFVIPNYQKCATCAIWDSFSVFPTFLL